MWPWEHLAVGYLAYSLYSRVVLGRRPTGPDAVVLAFATQLPDLVDKPLSWVLALLPDGTTVAHSVFVAVPVSLVVYRIAARRGRPELGAAFAVGYLSHLPGDVLYPVFSGSGPAYTKLLWPVFTKHGAGGSVTARVSGYFGEYVQLLLSPEGAAYLGFELLLLVATLAVWLADGVPGVAWLLRTVRTRTRRDS